MRQRLLLDSYDSVFFPPLGQENWFIILIFCNGLSIWSHFHSPLKCFGNLLAKDQVPELLQHPTAATIPSSLAGPIYLSAFPPLGKHSESQGHVSLTIIPTMPNGVSEYLAHTEFQWDFENVDNEGKKLYMYTVNLKHWTQDTGKQ